LRLGLLLLALVAIDTLLRARGAPRRPWRRHRDRDRDADATIDLREREPAWVPLTERTPAS
jgi:hypothetical protein